MKRWMMIAAAVAGLSLRSFAGTETAPVADSKDMKQVVSQVAPSDAGVYIAAFGGASFDTWYGDNRQTLSGALGSTLTSTTEIKSGWGGVGGIKIGYNFQSYDTGWDGLRLQPAVEAEGMYIGGSGSTANSFITPSTTKFSSNSGDFFLNGLVRFKNGSIFTPYIGLGVGLQYVTTHGDFEDAIFQPVNNLGLPVGSHVHATGLDTSDLDFAAQGLIGVSVPITSHITLFTEYKYVDALGTDGKSTDFLKSETYRFKPDQLQQNLITAGITYNF
jgi:opacity protein-like surface antigen